MVGVVIVSHSVALAHGLRELAGSMAQGRVRIEVAAGLDEDEGVLGTDPLRIQRAIDRAWSDDGVLVLMDLGSALLSAEMAVELLADERRGRVRLCAAPLVEGTVAAVAQAAGGQSLEQVEAEALGALATKAAHLGPSAAASSGVSGEMAGMGAGIPAGAGIAAGAAGMPSGAAGIPAGAEGLAAEAGGIVSMRTVVRDPFGLHARPAARFVSAAARIPLEVRVSNVTRGTGPVSARSINQVMTLGIREGDEIELAARGGGACDVREALRGVAEAIARDGAEEIPRGASSVEPWEPPAVASARQALPASPGIAVGRVRRWEEAEPDASVGAAESAEEACERLELALSAAEAELSALQAETASRLGEGASGIFAAHLLMVRDPVLGARTRALVHEESLPAREAWRRAVAGLRRSWERVEDPYLRERVADLDDVAHRVGRFLAAGNPVEGSHGCNGALGGTAGAKGPAVQAAVIVAADLPPSVVAGLRAEDTLGLCLARGTPLSHAAILARSLGIPAVVGAGTGILEVAEGTLIALDGGAGRWWVEPDADTLAALEERQREQGARLERSREDAGGPAHTRDGHLVAVRANVGGCAPADIEALRESGADGVGLVRTEFLFLDRVVPPGEGEQVAAYEALAGALGDGPLVIRTADIGGDKPVPYLDVGGEANPFLGWRGIRQSLDLPGLLETQLRAILRVAAGCQGRRVRLMLPMVASAREVRAAREAVDRARASLERDGLACGAVEMGIMIEVPAAAVMADRLAPLVDFFSIGTNDLTQYVMAADRTHARLGALLDALEPAVLRLVARAALAAAAQGIPVAVCGEVAADPAAVPVLIGLGVQELSVAPRSVAGVKAEIRRWSLPDAKSLAEQALQADTASAVRTLIAAGHPEPWEHGSA